jgi:uncharacterized membrane protein HdeD (DUF308 family)
MNLLRYTAASLLLFTGILHAIPLLKGTDDPNSLPMLLFGLAYLVIGIILFLNKMMGKILGIILPLLGLGIGFLWIGVENWNVMLSLMFLIDAIVVIICTVLLFRK